MPARVIAVEQCLAEASGLLVEKLMTRLEGIIPVQTVLLLLVYLRRRAVNLCATRVFLGSLAMRSVKTRAPVSEGILFNLTVSRQNTGFVRNENAQTEMEGRPAHTSDSCRTVGRSERCRR